MQLSVLQTRFRTSVISSGTDFGKKFMDKFITCLKRSCDDNASSAPTTKKCNTRKYDVSYLQFGFTVAGTDAEPLPQCVICADLLVNDSMKPWGPDAACVLIRIISALNSTE